MMLPTDIALIAEPAFRKWVEIYAKDEEKFFKVSPEGSCCQTTVPRFLNPSQPASSFENLSLSKDFASAFSKLLALGVPAATVKPWYQFW
jgi:cytochrome c peroxidase